MTTTAEVPGAGRATAGTTGSRLLAARARDLAARAPAGSMDRKAAGCAAVARAESSTVQGARKVLGLLWQDDVRQAALDLIDQLAAEDE
jgi:hypothetical protein